MGPQHDDRLREPLDEEERELMDPDHWDWETPVEAEFLPNMGAILEIRFTRDEVARLQRLAHAEDMSIHEFIKHAALARLPQEART